MNNEQQAAQQQAAQQQRAAAQAAAAQAAALAAAQGAVPVLQKEYLQIIPEFKGDVQQLPRFIQIGDKLVEKFYNPGNPDDFQNEYLLHSLLSKIKDEAHIQISNCVINNWADLKAALLTTYADKRDIFTLTIELTDMKQKMNENPFDFYYRIMNNLNLQSAYLTTHIEEGPRVTMKSFANGLGLRVLLRGLREPIGPLMRTRDPKDLAEALNIMTNDFQIDAPSIKMAYNNQQKRSFSNNYTTGYNNNKQNQTFRSINQQNYYIPPAMRNNQQPSHNQQNAQVYNQQGYNQHPNNQNRYNGGNNRQNTQPLRNNNNTTLTRNNTTQYNRNLPAPTPMSISTRNTTQMHNVVTEPITDEIIDDTQPDEAFGYTQNTEQNDIEFNEDLDPNFWIGASENNSN